MKYYLKQAVLPFIYLLFMLFISLGILTIKDELMVLKVILNLLNLAMYLLVICITSFKDGEDAMKVRYANDLEREQIVRTGEDRPLKLKEEYKGYKGFVTGFIVCAPLIILMLAHTIAYFVSGGESLTFGAIAGVIYFCIFSFFRLKTSASVTATTYYFTLVALPIIVLAIGISYNLGARKVYLQREAINQKQRMIYGDKK